MPYPLNNFRQMVPQNNVRSANAHQVHRATANLLRNVFEILKKRLDESIELVTRRCHAKRTPLKQTYAEALFELKNLRAHRGLLNPVGHLTNGFRNATMPRHIIEQFEVVDVHAHRGGCGGAYGRYCVSAS